MSSDYTNGGLKVINIKDMQNALLLKWVLLLGNKENATWKTIPLYYYSQLGTNLSVFESNASKNNIKGTHLIKSAFYQKILNSWLTHNIEAKNDNGEGNLSNIIWNNIHLTYTKKYCSSGSGLKQVLLI